MLLWLVASTDGINTGRGYGVNQSINQSFACLHAVSVFIYFPQQLSANDKVSGNKWEARAASSSKYG